MKITKDGLIRPCPRCGDPHYIDGCLDCGYGIDGDYDLENQVLA